MQSYNKTEQVDQSQPLNKLQVPSVLPGYYQGLPCPFQLTLIMNPPLVRLNPASSVWCQLKSFQCATRGQMEDAWGDRCRAYVEHTPGILKILQMENPLFMYYYQWREPTEINVELLACNKIHVRRNQNLKINMKVMLSALWVAAQSLFFLFGFIRVVQRHCADYNYIQN